MIIEQKIFFDGLNFTECEFEYPSGSSICYKGPDDCYYRVDHFGNTYVIEYAEDENSAKNNWFEDTDLYDDSLQHDELISIIRADLIKFVNDSTSN